MTILALPQQRTADVTVDELSATVLSPLARCARSALDPDEWYPIATKPVQARAEAARALAVCAVCPVRAECLELSMRVWDTGGEHGIWGGLVEADRVAVHTGWRAGTPVTASITA